MLDLRLIFRRDGTFHPASRFDLERAHATYGDGEEVRAKTSHKRSVRQNDYFHAICEDAWLNQRTGPQLPNWRALKAWLLIRVGHCNERRVHVGKLTLKEAMAAGAALALALRINDEFVGVSYDKATGEFVMRAARSVSFNAVTSDEMGEIVDNVVAAICTEILPGTEPEEIRTQAKARAA